MQEEELVAFLAQHCYVHLGASARSEAIQELLPSCIPSKLYRTKTPEKWASLVTAVHTKVSLHRACALGLCISFGGDRGTGCVEVVESLSPGREANLPVSVALSVQGETVSHQFQSLFWSLLQCQAGPWPFGIRGHSHCCP